MAAGQSPLSCWTHAAGDQELLWPGRSALAARTYNLGQESQANGPILLIQPRGQHTAAPSSTARREDESGGGGAFGGICTGPASKDSLLYTRKGLILEIQLNLQPCLDLVTQNPLPWQLFWTRAGGVGGSGPFKSSEGC